MCKRADKIVVHGQEASVALQDMGAKCVEVVPHGIEWYPTRTTLLSQSDGKLHVGCFGHANPNRGLLDISEACKHINNVHLHIHASAQMTDEHDAYLEKVHQAVRDEEWITFDTAHAHLKDVVAQLSQYDVNVWYCNPPGGISASGSICQYIAAGRPIVASKTVMVQDVRDAVTTVPPCSPDLLAQAIQQYNTDTRRLRELCSVRAWKHARPSYQDAILPSFRSHFLYWGAKDSQEQEMEEAIRIMDDLCARGDTPDLDCSNLTELHSRFMVDPLATYNHQYENGSGKTLDKTLLFLHLQKTGGTTLSHIIRRNVRSIGLRLDFSGQPNINPAFLLDAYHDLSLRRKRQEQKKWSKYDVLTNHFGYGIHNLLEGPYAYITMLRDPVARFISYYRNIQAQPHTSWIGSNTYAAQAKHLPLKEFIEDNFFRNAVMLGHSSTQMIAGTRDLELSEYNLLRAKQHLRTFDAVLLTEEFEKSLEILHALYGFVPETFDGKNILPWKGERFGRVTGGDNARDELSHDEISMIEGLLHFDMKLYEYARNLFSEQYAALQCGESLTSSKKSVILDSMSTKVNNTEEGHSVVHRIITYIGCVLRIPTNIAKIAEYGGQTKDQLSSLKKLDHLDQLSSLKKLDHLDQLSTIIDIIESVKHLEPRLDTVIDRLNDLQKVSDRINDFGPKWDVLMDRIQDMTTQANGIAYNMNDVIASLEAVADIVAANTAERKEALSTPH